MTTDNKSAGGSRSTGRGRRRLRTVAVLASVSAALLAVLLFCSSFVSYAVSYEGADLGLISSRSELASAIGDAEARATAILGERRSLAGEITVTTGIGVSSGGAEALSARLLENVEGISKQYAITVDGVAVARGEAPQPLFAILDAILERYTTDRTVGINFAQTVSVEYTLVNEALEADPAAIAALLDPDNGGLTVVSRELVKRVTAIPYETVVQYDASRYSDELTIVQSGREGTFCASYLVSLENGQEVSTTTADSLVLMEPTAEVISVGSRPGSRTDSTGTYVWPTQGIITSGYGSRTGTVGSSNHQGLDIANDKGTPVYAADGGEVIYAQDSGPSGYGLLIKLQHDNGDLTFYAHLSAILVREGDRVAQGDLIGKIGSTGVSSGPHLHFELRPGGGYPINAYPYLTTD